MRFSDFIGCDIIGRAVKRYIFYYGDYLDEFNSLTIIIK